MKYLMWFLEGLIPGIVCGFAAGAFVYLGMKYLIPAMWAVEQGLR